MDNDDVHIAAAIPLGAYLRHLHKCYHCGNDVDTTAIHGLSCLKSAGRSFRHTAINTIIQRALHVCRQHSFSSMDFTDQMVNAQMESQSPLGKEVAPIFGIQHVLTPLPHRKSIRQLKKLVRILFSCKCYHSRGP